MTLSKKMIKVSVVIPVYNVEKYIAECLDSLISQTLKNIEIICVDDGSTDQSLLVLKKYAERDGRIIVRHQENKGAGSARNLALRFANGKYIVFLDADDFFEPDMLEKCVMTLEEEQSDIVGFLARRYDHETGIFKEMPKSIKAVYCPKHSPFSPHEISRYIFNLFQIAPWNKMFRHSFIKEKKLKFQEIPRANDVAFFFQALALAGKISVIQETFVNYRVNTGTSLQQTNDKTPLSFWEAFKEAKERLRCSGSYGEYEQSFLNNVLANIFYNLRSVKTEEARALILSHIKNCGEKDFCFLTHPLSYYYNSKLILEYCVINAESPIVLERLNEDHRIKEKKIQKLKSDLKKIKQSKSFYIGELLAKPFRKIKTMLK